MSHIRYLLKTAERFLFRHPFKLATLKTAIRNAGQVEFCGEGESLGYPRIEETLGFIYSLNHRARLLRIFTNGSTLSRRMAGLLGTRFHYLRISLNAATPETYRRVTRHDKFESTLASVEEFLSALDERDISRIHLHFVASTVNYAEIPAFVVLASRLGIRNVSVGNIEISRTEQQPYSLLNIRDAYDGKIVEARNTARSLGLHLHARAFRDAGGGPGGVPRCEMFRNAFVELDGGISPCNNAGRYRIGNVYREGFERSWFSPEYVSLRRRGAMPACRACIYYTPFQSAAAHFTSHFHNARQ